MPTSPHSRARLSALAAALSVSMLASAGLAQDAKDLARARERFKEAAALQAAGDFARALEGYKDVAVIKSSAQVRFNIATCEERLGDYVRAVGSYRFALTEATRSNAKDIEAAVQRALESLEPRIPRLLVKRGQGAAVAEVTLDGRPLANPSIGVEFPINPGPHSIRATSPDRDPVTVEINLTDGDRKAVEIVLKPRVVKAVPVVEPPPPPPPPPPPEPRVNKPMLIGGIAVGGAGVVSLALSGAFFGLRQGAISTLQGECGADMQHCPANARSTYDGGVKDATIATGTLIAGLGALAIGGTLVIVATRQKAQAPTAGFVVTPGGGAIQGTF